MAAPKVKFRLNGILYRRSTHDKVAVEYTILSACRTHYVKGETRQTFATNEDAQAFIESLRQQAQRGPQGKPHFLWGAVANIVPADSDEPLTWSTFE